MPNDLSILQSATAAVAEKFGTHLCAWADKGARRICTAHFSPSKTSSQHPCRCQQVAETVLESAIRSFLSKDGIVEMVMNEIKK